MDPMKRCIILSIMVLASANVASADQGALCLFSDAAGTQCDFVDNGGVIQVFIVHTQLDGATASRFRLDVSATGWTHLSDSWNYPLAIGSSVYDVSIGYGQCETSTIVVGSVAFTGTSTAPGTPIRIVPAYYTDHIQIADCDNRSLIGAGGTAYVNSATPCICQVNQTPVLDVVNPGLDFGYTDTTRTFTVVNLGGGTLSWNLSESIPWLELSTTGGVNLGDVTVTIDRTGLAPGNHSGEIALTSNAGTRTVPVSMTVLATDPILRIVPAYLVFDGFQTDLTMLIFNDGAAGLDWTVNGDQSWLSVTPASGTGEAEVNVHVDRAGLTLGMYSGNLAVTSNGGNGTVEVTLLVRPPYPILALSKTSLFYPPSISQRTIQVSNVGSETLIWNITSDKPWLSPSPGNGVNNNSVMVSVDRSLVGYNNYFGNLIVTSNGGNDTIQVEMQKGYPDLNYSPQAISFGLASTDTILHIWNSRGGYLNWSIQDNAAWLTRNPSSGLNNAEVLLTVDRTGLANGTYWADLYIYSAGGNAMIRISMAVHVPYPELQVSPASFSFSWLENEKFLDITNTGDADLSWNITNDQPWMSVTPTSGLNDQQVTVTVDRTGLADGPYTGKLTITSNDGDKIVPVNMWSGPLPILQVEPLFLDFTPTDSVKTFQITNTGDGDLNWTLSADEPWIEIPPPLSGPNDAIVTVNVHPDSLPSPGVHFGNITVRSVYDTLVVGVRYVPPGVPGEGTIAVFSDAGASNTNFVDTGSLVQVHFFYVHHSGAKAARFRLAAIPGWIPLGDLWQVQDAAGSSTGGVFLQFGTCLAAPTYLGVANFFGNAAPACSPIYIVADPASGTGQIMVVDCADVVKVADGGTGYVNSDGSCGWGPVRQTTWGQIRALYAPRPSAKSENK
jgi:hypothetical protein